MFQRLAIISIALFTALPAIAGHSYTSSAPESTGEYDYNTAPILIQDDENGRLYASRGFSSLLAEDGNLYIDRIFAESYTDGGHDFIVVKTTQIDCGRGVARATSVSGSRDGQRLPVTSTDWRRFRTDSPIARTCVKAASDRDINWRWNTEE